jgi:hypothetical protein
MIENLGDRSVYVRTYIRRSRGIGYYSSRHVELAVYANDMALAAASRKPSLLDSYLETNLDRLEHWLRS